MKKTVCIFFMGFKQTHKEVTGLEKVWRRVWNNSPCDAWVLHPFYWDVDTKILASFIDRNIEKDTKVMVVAFSWGVGQGFTNFADNLKQLGRDIDVAILCDGVYRTRWIPTWLLLNPLALVKESEIKIEDNVKEVFWVRQYKYIPSGHDLIAKDPTKTQIHDPVVLNLEHKEMDDSLEFRKMVLDVVDIMNEE